jgi:peptide/nickel transport system substrate-binding protein
LKIFFERSAITKMQAAIVAIIVIVAAVIGAVYYVTLPSPSPSPSASTSPSPSASANVTTTRLVRRGESFPCYIDPAVGADFCSQDGQTNLYDPLVWPVPGGGVIPWIATSWTVSTDNLNYTFTIRQGVTFHDGGTLTANDVAFSMQRLLTVGQGYSWIYTDYINNVTGITVIDTNTVMFHLNKPEGAFLDSLVRLYIVEKATVLANIVTPGTYGTLGDYGTTWLATHDAGSGPYKLKAISVSSYVYMTQFSGYWNPQSVDPLAPTEVDLVATAASSATEKTLMLNKQLEVSDEWQGDSFLTPLNTTGYITAESHADAGEYYYMMNTQKKPTDDVYVRKALAYAFDYVTTMTMIYSRFQQSASCLPMALPGAVNVTPYYYNLTLAGEMLKQSKYYPDIINNPQNYPITFQVMNEVPERMSDALHFAETAAIIGLNVQVTSIPWGEMVGEVGNYTTSPNLLPIVVDPLFLDAGSMLAERYSIASQGSFDNCVWLNNATLDAEIANAQGTNDTSSRRVQYGHIQQEIMNICPDIWVYDFKVAEAVQTYVWIPQMHNASSVIGIQGYNCNFKTWQVSPAT